VVEIKTYLYSIGARRHVSGITVITDTDCQTITGITVIRDTDSQQIAEITVIRDTDCQKIAGITVIRDTEKSGREYRRGNHKWTNQTKR
jgi:hypothetical protein